MNLNITIDVETAGLEQQILKQITAQAQQFLKKVSVSVRAPILQVIGEAVEASPEYASLQNGILREDFGIAQSGPALAGIVQAIKQSCQIEVYGASSSNLGGIRVSVIKSDFSDVLSVEGTSYTSTSRRGSHLIPWLSWLLFEGDKIILADFQVDYNADSRPQSRTGRAIMVERPKPGSKKAAGSFAPFRVRPEFAGTQESNWLIRAVEPVMTKILAVIQKEMTNVNGNQS